MYGKHFCSRTDLLTGKDLNQIRAREAMPPEESMTLKEYLKLLDWVGRQRVAGKQGSIPAELAPILERLGIAAARNSREYSRVVSSSGIRCDLDFLNP